MERRTQFSATLRVAAFDLVAVALSVWIGFRLRFGFVREIPVFYLANQNRYILTTFLILLGMELLCGGGGYLPAFSAADGARVLLAVAGTAGMLLLLDRYLQLGIPLEVLIIQALLLAAFLLAIRFSIRLLQQADAWRAGAFRRAGKECALIYGAGEAGRYLCRRILTRPEENLRVVGFIDDDPALLGARIQRVRVLGGVQHLPQILRETHASQLILAIEQFPRTRLSSLLETCREHDCQVKRFGSVEELRDNRLDTARINDIRLEDLLRRDSVTLSDDLPRRFVQGRCVMVTGGAGSIGSELCRQLLAMGARLLVVFDIHENGLYALDNELREHYGPERYRLCIGSVRDKDRLLEVMREYAPEILFHAAAHKHVPMMEWNPREAVKNNVFGTLRTADAAIKCGVRRFILISTDKAVNPANVMGATKRIAELCIQMLDREGQTRFAAVRFGNVLGSCGSVVPLFKSQIERGGPVTVTHPDMRRYFMTIPEAVQLVLEAGAMARGGEIFVLDMGEPVKIFDLACDMIRLSGLAPGRDIPIVFSGLRPGEKLFEELRLAEEDTIKTANNQIYVNKPVPFDTKTLRCNIGALYQALDEPDNDTLFEAIRALVPTFTRDENRLISQSARVRGAAE
ncbi:nucleoside-diphosphate sugar epimerase/dehydratase [Ligaoa zhengdingensis]|uniref:polysaccharide biosynthesis protein n=2 Tax=Ligaoa zhengdingensis TaxID=2763658 RepID=UPI0031B9EED0